MAARAVNRRMPSSDTCYILLQPPMNISSEPFRLPYAPTVRCIRLEFGQEETHV